jgi:hypothetical protein
MKLKFISIALIFTNIQFVYCQIKNDWSFKRELISYMQSPKDTIYIEDRKKLERIGVLKCNDSLVTFNDTTKSGRRIFISISNTKFIADKHSLHLSDTVFKFIHNEKRIDYLITRNLIDGRPSYGTDGGYPNFEMNALKIKWNRNWLSIPDSAFQNLLETHLCLSYLPVEAYITKNNKLLYIYIAASDGAGSYAVKFVFDRNKYLTRIVNRNECSDGFDFLDANASCD